MTMASKDIEMPCEWRPKCPLFLLVHRSHRTNPPGPAGGHWPPCSLAFNTRNQETKQCHHQLLRWGRCWCFISI